MTILAIDPGTTESAVVLWDGKFILSKDILPNAKLRDILRLGDTDGKHLYIEMIKSYGMRVGAEVFDTCLWIGRFMEAWEQNSGRPANLVTRMEEKMHHCHSPKADDASIRRALIDRFGPPGKKKSPGLTYGLKADMWQAFAIAVLAYDRWEETSQPGAV